MDILALLTKEFEQEVITTRKMLQRVPDDRFGWKPHVKSMTMLQLTTHIAELPGFISMGLNTTELDFAVTPYSPAHVENSAQLLELYEKFVEGGRQSLASATESDLLPEWTLNLTLHNKGNIAAQKAGSQIV